MLPPRDRHDVGSAGEDTDVESRPVGGGGTQLFRGSLINSQGTIDISCEAGYF